MERPPLDPEARDGDPGAEEAEEDESAAGTSRSAAESFSPAALRERTPTPVQSGDSRLSRLRDDRPVDLRE